MLELNVAVCVFLSEVFSTLDSCLTYYLTVDLSLRLVLFRCYKVATKT